MCRVASSHFSKESERYLRYGKHQNKYFQGKYRYRLKTSVPHQLRYRGGYRIGTFIAFNLYGTGTVYSFVPIGSSIFKSIGMQKRPCLSQLVLKKLLLCLTLTPLNNIIIFFPPCPGQVPVTAFVPYFYSSICVALMDIFYFSLESEPSFDNEKHCRHR